jgi:hypothetical protein
MRNRGYLGTPEGWRARELKSQRVEESESWRDRELKSQRAEEPES